MPGLTDHAVHGVEVGGAGDGLLDTPLAAHVAQRPAGGAGLALGLLVHRTGDAAPEDDEREHDADQHTGQDHEPQADTAEQETEAGEHGDGADHRRQHQRDERLVVLALHLERLPHL
ncbi:MAG: hypothetical protein QM703_19160 [Gemmatales bacterium]